MGRMRLAITGGTGSLGNALIHALAEDPDIERLVSVSRDEVKAGELAERHAGLSALRCILADVRDRERLEQAFQGCDAVIHAAALKRVEQSTYSPSELIKTNVLGTMNVIAAATAVGVGKVLVVSSDKAVEPVNLYGMTKAVAEGYAVQANSYTYPRGTRVACVRYGNVLGSRGSVVHVWRAQLRCGASMTITDLGMTRFILTLSEAAQFCLTALQDMEGGEVFVPQLPAVALCDLAVAVANQWMDDQADDVIRGGAKAVFRNGRPRHVIMGLRVGGEKRHEALLSREEPTRVRLRGDRFIVLPSFHPWREKWENRGESVTAPYTSEAPARWLGVEELVEMLRGVP